MEHIALECSTMQEQANLITAGSDKSSSSASTSQPARELLTTPNSRVRDDDDLDVTYRVYRRRWFGLAQLVLLNIIVSWDVSGLIHKTIHSVMAWKISNYHAIAPFISVCTIDLVSLSD